ncbi:SGNH/GDSL hydrolase family protein [Mucilaginibacter xinganensis]|uniref:Mixed-linked glucanase n=1 Tax=Mucilaginibacter xinganensis TaxID=1234841 RepID=A0A223NX38_9SPHI|nr:SGNH/GDSL hydrolase family protein [Mucilaginibacter xinganensis]ASU34425.1 mixed-linked glucanase [Mucilaginibacter xinganensis]
MKKLLIILLLLASFITTKAQVTPQWKALNGGILNFYPGKSPSGYDSLMYLSYLRTYFGNTFVTKKYLFGNNGLVQMGDTLTSKAWIALDTVNKRIDAQTIGDSTISGFTSFVGGLSLFQTDIPSGLGKTINFYPGNRSIVISNNYNKGMQYDVHPTFLDTLQIPDIAYINHLRGIDSAKIYSGNHTYTGTNTYNGRSYFNSDPYFYNGLRMKTAGGIYMDDGTDIVFSPSGYALQGGAEGYFAIFNNTHASGIQLLADKSILNGNNEKLLTENAANSIYGVSKRRLGTIYNIIPNTANSALYTTVGSGTTWTYSTTGLTTSGGDGTVANQIRYNKWWTNASYYERCAKFISTTAGSGIGVSLWSLSASATLSAKINTSTGTLTLEVYRSGTTTTKATSASNLTIATGDTIQVKMVRSMANFFVTAKDLNTGVTVFINYTDPYTSGTVQTSWSAAESTIVHYGGSQKIINDSYVVNNIVGNDIVWYGNSIGAGLSSGSANNAAANIIGANTNDNVNVIAGGSNRTSDFILLENEIKALRPRMIFYTDGINDIINSISQDTTNAHITAAAQFARTNGIQMVFNSILPVGPTYGGASNATYQAAIITTNTFETTITDAIQVNTYSSVLNASTSALDPLFDSGDQLHPNRFGQEAVAAFNSAFVKGLSNLGNLSHNDPNGWKVIAQVGARGGVTVQNVSQNASASSMFTTLSNNNVTQVTFGIASSTSASNYNDANGALNGQAITTGKKFFVGATDKIIINVGSTAVSANNKAYFTATAGIKLNDKVWFGDTTGTATARVHIKAGTATATTAPLKFGTGGVVLTTPEALALESTNTSLFFTDTVSTVKTRREIILDTKTQTLTAKTFGDKLRVSTSVNAGAGTATLVAGTVTVSNTSAVTGSLIFFTRISNGGTVGTLSYTISNGVSFTINSTSATDTSTIGYTIIN